jgi:hypothetical protein
MHIVHEIDIDTDRRMRIGIPWMPIRIRQNDADPSRSGSGSTTLVGTVPISKAIRTNQYAPFHFIKVRYPIVCLFRGIGTELKTVC